MNKIHISFITIFYVIIGYFCIFSFSCASTSPSAVSSDSAAVAITVPEKKRNDFFISVSPDIIAKIENGSPESIRSGIGLMRKSMLDYKEDEKILLVVAANIMNIVWPSERVSWEIPEVSNTNPYIGAIESARNGIYDTSTGNKDFLSTLLPSLVLLTSSSRDDYYDLSYNALSLALNMRRDSVLANYLMGILLCKMQRFDESIKYLKNASAAIPTCFNTSYSLALGYKLSGDIAAARNAAELLVVQYPQNIDVLKLCSETAFAQKDYTSAEEYVVRVLQQEPENKQFVLFRVKVLLEKKEYMKAAS
ncbi:MAG: hypothetical protein K6F69_08680, partial [Treponema sp.]|nr:hypothetical protein [Treponema sp.]